MPLPFALLFVVLAVLGWGWTLLAFDRQDTPPKISNESNLFAALAFAWGALVALLAFVLETSVGNNQLLRAGIEEVSKWLGLGLLFLWARALCRVAAGHWLCRTHRRGVSARRLHTALG